MALISALSAFPKKMSRVTLRLGEESEPIALVAESGDPDLDGFVLLTVNDHRIASAELSPTPPSSVPVPDKRKRTFVVTGRKPGSASSLPGPALPAALSILAESKWLSRTSRKRTSICSMSENT